MTTTKLPAARSADSLSSDRSHTPLHVSDVMVQDLTRLDQVDTTAWDALVPRDTPHLRSGFLRAVEVSRQAPRPHYLCATWNGTLVGVMVVYEMAVDLLTLAPRSKTVLVRALRQKLAPNLLYLRANVCGPIVTNCNHNFCLSAVLGANDKQVVVDALLTAMQKLPGNAHLLFEFPEDEVGLFAPVLAKHGFLQAHSLPGTRLDVRWKSVEEYTALMRKAFRRTVLKDLKRAEDLTFEIVDDFGPIAEEAWRLYRNVVDKADNVFEELTLPFFRELARFEQSRLVVAREKTSGKIVGVEVLLCGDTVLQDLYTGVDYAHNEEQHVYFNLLYPVIGFAGASGFQRISLGQTSYTFKSRLGVTFYPMFLFLKHNNPVVQRIITALRTTLFPVTPTATHHVFRDGATDGSDAEEKAERKSKGPFPSLPR